MTALFGLAGRVPLLAWVAAALLAWGGWQRIQARSAQADAAQARVAAQQHASQAQAEREARELEHQTARRAQEALDAYAKDRDRVAAASVGARAELQRLRDQLAAAGRPGAAASAASSAGRADDAQRLATVAAECGTALQAVAEDAAACGARLNGLQEWVRAATQSSR